MEQQGLHPETIRNALYIFGFVFGIVFALLGVIWHMLNQKIEHADSANANALTKQDTQTASALSKLEISFKEVNHQTLMTFKNSVEVLVNSLNERLNAQSARITASTTRVDSINDQLASLRVRLAEDYHNTDETRRLIDDLQRPLREQLARVEQIAEEIRKNTFINRGGH